MDKTQEVSPDCAEARDILAQAERLRQIGERLARLKLDVDSLSDIE